MMQTAVIALLLIGGYLLGSLPFGLWITRAWKGIDIRTLGSGNIGATNVWRVCGKEVGIVVFTLDVLKGFLPPVLGARLGVASEWQILAALLAMIGHSYSVFLGFKGGKGIATGLGMMLGVAWQVGLSAFGLFLLELVTGGYVSVGSILGAVSLPILMPVFYPHDSYRLAFALAACLLAVFKHRANIQRLRAGTEPKVRLFGKKEVPPAAKPTLDAAANADAAENLKSKIQNPKSQNAPNQTFAAGNSEKDASANAPR